MSDLVKNHHCLPDIWIRVPRRLWAVTAAVDKVDTAQVLGFSQAYPFALNSVDCREHFNPATWIGELSLAFTHYFFGPVDTFNLPASNFVNAFSARCWSYTRVWSTRILNKNILVLIGTDSNSGGPKFLLDLWFLILLFAKYIISWSLFVDLAITSF